MQNHRDDSYANVQLKHQKNVFKHPQASTEPR